MTKVPDSSPSVRDRVTAILTLADPFMRNPAWPSTPMQCAEAAYLLVESVWAAGRLLEALNTIDSLRSENELLRNRWNRRRELPALNGGNE